jgi:hypothetical protein
MSDEIPTFQCPIPVVRPLGSLLDKPEYVQEVWDAYVKPEQDAELPPSVEMRLLMAILRAVAAGLSERTSE